MNNFGAPRGLLPSAVAGVALVVFLVAVWGLTRGESETATDDTTSTTATTVTTEAVRTGTDGYGAVLMTVKKEGEEDKVLCALLAQTPEQQAKGMMEREDLGGYDAMIFPFEQDSTARFYMANVPVALSIAWFDAVGAFVSSADMPPCESENPGECETYGASAPFRTAVEVLQGNLGAAGITEGSTMTYGGPCVS